MKLEKTEVLEELLVHCKGLEKELIKINKRENRRLVASIFYTFVSVGIYAYICLKPTKKKVKTEVKEDDKKVEEPK